MIDISKPIYKVGGLILSPFQEGYITEKYLSWFSDKEVSKYTSHRPITHAEALEYISTLGHNSYVWSIFSDCDANITHFNNYKMVGNHIGNVSLQSINHKNKTGEFAIIVGDREYWGKGVTTICLMWVIEQAFEEFKLNRVWLGTAAENFGMRKAAEKAGMIQEGVLRKHLFCDGKFMDCVQYGILKGDWDARRI